jgi:putative ABC transport system permease protein
MLATTRDVPIQNLRTLADQRDVQLSSRRETAIVLAVVCTMGIVLSSLGLYGVAACGVRGRAPEFGIRLALGAPGADVRRMVMRQGYRMTAAGLALGVAMSLAVSGVLRSVVFGVGVRDPLTIGVVSLILTAVSTLALSLPAPWATSVDPATTLRSE